MHPRFETSKSEAIVTDNQISIIIFVHIYFLNLDHKHSVQVELFDKDNQHFENLILRMIVSNGLSFTFIENQETQDISILLCQL